MIRPFQALIAAAALVLLPGASEYSPLDALRLDQVRMLGSHNSYRSFPSPREEARMKALAPQYWQGLAYGHPPLESQLVLGLHQFELDVVSDPKGGRFAAPYADATPEVRAVMNAPGIKVLHIPNFDTEVHCLTFRACLGIFARWSDRHPDHAPIVILVNSSDFPARPVVAPEPYIFSPADIDTINRDIAEVIGQHRLITPDMVRGKHDTLRQGVLAGGWPTMGAARGRFLFVLDGSADHERYLRTGHPSLRGRMMFGWFDEDTPEAALFNIQNPLPEQARIERLVKMGFIVRTRADADTAEARTHDGRRMQAAIASGAQLVSSDYYEGVPDPLGLDYVADFGGAKIRCDEVVTTCGEYR